MKLRQTANPREDTENTVDFFHNHALQLNT